MEKTPERDEVLMSDEDRTWLIAALKKDLQKAEDEIALLETALAGLPPDRGRPPALRVCWQTCLTEQQQAATGLRDKLQQLA